MQEPIAVFPNLMGEQAVRQNTYANDGDTLSDEDLAINVVDQSSVPDQLQPFYTGTADTVGQVN